SRTSTRSTPTTADGSPSYACTCRFTRWRLSRISDRSCSTTSDQISWVIEASAGGPGRARGGKVGCCNHIRKWLRCATLFPWTQGSAVGGLQGAVQPCQQTHQLLDVLVRPITQRRAQPSAAALPQPAHPSPALVGDPQQPGPPVLRIG